MKLFMSMVLCVSETLFAYLDGTTKTEEEKEIEKSAADLAREERENKKKTQALIRNVRVKTKVLMTMMQLLGQFPAVFTTIAFPKVYLDITVSIGALVNFDLFTAMPFVCFYPAFNFYDDLLSSTVGPLLVMFILFCVGIVLSWRARGDADATLEIRDRTAGILLLVAYLVFSSVSTKLFQVRSRSMRFLYKRQSIAVHKCGDVPRSGVSLRRVWWPRVIPSVRPLVAVLYTRVLFVGDC